MDPEASPVGHVVQALDTMDTDDAGDFELRASNGLVELSAAMTSPLHINSYLH